MEIQDVSITPPPEETTIYYPSGADREAARKALGAALESAGLSSLRVLPEQGAAALPGPSEAGEVPGDDIRWVLIPGTDSEREVDVPLLRLHRPQHEGCTASYGFGREKSVSASVSFTLGVSVGGTATVSVKASRTYTADQHCIEVVSRAKVRVGQYRVLVDGAEIARIWRTDVLHFDPRVRDPRPLAPEADGCNVPFDQAHALPEFESDDLRGGGDPSGGMDVTMARTTKASVELKPVFGDKLKAELALGLERETSTTTSISAELTPGRRYTVYVPRSGNTMERCWTAD